MRIAIVNWTQRLVGGAEVYLEQIIPGLRNRGHAVRFWYEYDEPKDRPRLTIEGELFAQAESQWPALAEWKPDLIFLHGLENNRTEALLPTIAPTVFLSHSYYGTCISGSKMHLSPRARACRQVFGPGCLALYYPRRCGGLNPRTFLHNYLRQRNNLIRLKKFDRVLALSSHIAWELNRHGITARWLPPVAPRFMKDEDDSDSRRESDPTRRIVFLGRLENLKGGQVLLSALPAVKKALGCKLAIDFAGSGSAQSAWELQALQIRARDPDIEITFPGWLDATGVRKLLQRATLLAMPSLWPEPLGLAGLEAAAQGVPSVAFDTGGIADWLTDGFNGHFATEKTPQALAQAIIRCVRAPQHYAQLRVGARLAAGQFSLDHHLDHLLDCFQAL